MSAKRRKKSEHVPIRYDVESLASMISAWEEHRRVRDMGGGNRQMSEAVLKQITGKWTEFELIHGMINDYEQQAEEAFQDWRRSHSFELHGEDGPAPVRRDLSPEIYAFREQLRAVMASGDKELIKAWVAERPWSEQILIPLILSQKPTREIITF